MTHTCELKRSSACTGEAYAQVELKRGIVWGCSPCIDALSRRFAVRYNLPYVDDRVNDKEKSVIDRAPLDF